MTTRRRFLKLTAAASLAPAVASAQSSGRVVVVNWGVIVKQWVDVQQRGRQPLGHEGAHGALPDAGETHQQDVALHLSPRPLP